MPNPLREPVQNMIEAAPRKRPTSQTLAMVRLTELLVTVTFLLTVEAGEESMFAKVKRQEQGCGETRRRSCHSLLAQE